MTTSSGSSVSSSPTMQVVNVSRWYGNVVAVNDVSFSLGPGITGLLGPNGAGKSTILHMIAGFLRPSKGTVRINGRPAWRNHEIYRQVGLVPEKEAVYAFLTGHQFVLTSAKLFGLSDPAEAARRAIRAVDMEAHQDRRLDGYSKGMKQRMKVAAAIVHRPLLTRSSKAARASQRSARRSRRGRERSADVPAAVSDVVMTGPSSI